MSKILFLIFLVISNLQAVQEHWISPSFPYDMFFKKLDEVFPSNREDVSSDVFSDEYSEELDAKKLRQSQREDREKSKSFYFIIYTNSILRNPNTAKQKEFTVEYVNSLIFIVRDIDNNTFNNETDKEIFMDFMTQIIYWSTLVDDSANHKNTLISLAQMAFEKMKLIDSKQAYTKLTAIMKDNNFFNPLTVLPDSEEVRAEFFDDVLSYNLLNATGKTLVDSVKRTIELLDEDPEKNKDLFPVLVKMFDTDGDFKLINDIFPLEKMATEVGEGSAAMLVRLAHFHPFFAQIISKYMNNSLHKPRIISDLDPSNMYVKFNKEGAAIDKIIQDLKEDHERKIQQLKYEGQHPLKKAAHNIKTQVVLSGKVIHFLYNSLRLYAASWIPSAKSTLDQSSEESISAERKKILDFLADYLTLKHLSLDGALSEVHSIHLLKTDVFSISDLEMDVLSSRIKKNFSWGILKEISDKFDSSAWKGYVKAHKAEEGEVQVFSKQEEKTLNYNDFIYSYGEVKSEKTPEAIVIEAYSGYSKEKCSSSNSVRTFNTPAIFIKLKHLGDCDQGLFQDHQLLEKNLANTHVLFLKRMSDFIKQYKEKNPTIRDLPVFLKGTSFGGFFVTSYGLLQSVFVGKKPLDTIYKNWAAIALKSAFPTEGDLSTIHGVISSEGAIDNIAKIAKPDALSEFSVPIYVSQNIDDDRVKWNGVFPVIKSFPESMLWVAFNRRGAIDFGAEIDEGLTKQRSGSISSTTRGHADGPMEDLPNFIAYSMQKIVRSEFGVEQQRIRMRDYEGVGKKEHRDIEQFLSNLQLTQRIIESRKKTISEDEKLDLGLYGIEYNPLTKKEKYDELMQTVTKRSLWNSMKKAIIQRNHMN